MTDEETVCFKLINSAAKALDCYNRSIQQSMKYKFTEAKELIQEGETAFIEGQKEHFNLITKSVNDSSNKVSLLLVHAEDQMMIAEVTKLRAIDSISLYQKLEAIESKQNTLL